ncbi:MAG: DUF5658 family protein [Chloroflexota bacterium]
MIAFLAIQSADIITTAISLRRGAMEANLLPGWILSHFGEFGMYSFKALVACFVLFTVVRLSGRFRRLWVALRIVNIVMIPVLLINLTSILL